MRRFAQTVLLVLLGGMLGKLVITGTYLRYVRGELAPLLVIAGVALLVIAAVNLWRDLRSGADEPIVTGLRLDGLFGSDRLRAARGVPEPEVEPRAPAPELVGPEPSDVDHRARALAAGRAAAAHEGLDPADAAGAMNAPTAVFEVISPRTASGGPDSGGSTDDAPAATPSVNAVPPPRPRTRGGWALLVAALAVLLLAPPALGPFSAIQLGTVAGGGAVPADPLPPDDPVAMSLVDYVAHATAGGSTLAGRQVRLIGFVLAGPRGEPYLARLVIGCCAAGAEPVKVGLTGDLPGVLTPGHWVEVVGVYSEAVDPDPVNGAPIPYLSVVSVTEVAVPRDPYDG
jgi:uncharacterized repeat protein (TIGR03943 family)